MSTDSATAPQAGDLGWATKDDTQTDEAFLTALFAAAVNTPTDVIEGQDGIFRIGRVTEIVPVPLAEVAGKKKLVPKDHPWLGAARLVDTCFGD